MKRGLALVGVILLLAVPMVSAGFFNDFFENLMDKSGNQITGYAISDLLKTVSAQAATTTNPAVTTTTTAAKTTAIPALTAAKTTPTLATLPTAIKAAIPSIGVKIPSASLTSKPAAIAKVKLVKGLFKVRDDLTVSIISVGADKVANAKVEQMIANDKVININEKWYKVTLLENSRTRLTPVEAPKADTKDAAAATKAVKPGVLSKVVTKTPAAGVKIPSAAASTTKAAATPVPATTPTKTTTVSNLNLGDLLK